MDRITSFCVNHDILEPGIYISRIDGDVVTYDLRFIKPNTPPFLDQKSLHTIEHLFATYVRNSELTDNVIYFGPMGCRTGFYFLTRNLDHNTAINLIKETVDKCVNHKGEIPGNTKIECGNYLEHDFDKAIEDLKKYKKTIENITEKDIYYK